MVLSTQMVLRTTQKLKAMMDLNQHESRITKNRRKRSIAQRKDTTREAVLNNTRDDRRDKPKKPGKKYILFTKEVHDRIVQQNPGKKPKEVTVLISKEWANLDQTEKDKYQEIYIENK